MCVCVCVCVCVQVLDMLVRQPQLLLYYPQTLSAHMVSLMDLLEVCVCVMCVCVCVCISVCVRVRVRVHITLASRTLFRKPQ